MRDLLEELLGQPAGEKPKEKEEDKAASAKEEAKATPPTVRLSKSPVEAPAPAAPAGEEPELRLEIEEEETDSETLAELYINQGHPDKGLEVYRRLVAKDPDNVKLRERIMALEEGSAPPETPAQASRKARIRRLEGWLAVIRERRRS
jgi:hypothetical protein